MMNWAEHSDRKRVKTLLAMGFIPTWLEELLQSGDKLYFEKGFLKLENETLISCLDDTNDTQRQLSEYVKLHQELGFLKIQKEEVKISEFTLEELNITGRVISKLLREWNPYYMDDMNRCEDTVLELIDKKITDLTQKETDDEDE